MYYLLHSEIMIIVQYGAKDTGPGSPTGKLSVCPYILLTPAALRIATVD